jgi:N-acetylglucosamine kinase-like BadF-type ATPase
LKGVLGIDGGGTKTRAVITDLSGNVLGQGVSGPSNYDDIGVQQVKENLLDVIKKASRGLPKAIDIKVAYLGLAGITSVKDQETIRSILRDVNRLKDSRVTVTHDCYTALAGANGSKPGIIVIAGTGSSCFGRNSKGETLLAGGWGFLIGDIGSSFYLGKEAILAIVNAYDGICPQTLLTEPILKLLNISNISELMHRIYHPRLDRAGIASLATIVTETANEDPVSKSIIENSCDGLVRIIASVAQRLELNDKFDLSLIGGLANSGTLYTQMLTEKIKEKVPNAILIQPILPPVAGAVLLGLEKIGVSLNPKLIENLKQVKLP